MADRRADMLHADADKSVRRV